MSHIPNGGGNIFIAKGSTVSLSVTHNSAGWPGNAVIQAQATNVDAALETTLDSVVSEDNLHYSWNFHVHNFGPNNTSFNIQVSVI